MTTCVFVRNACVCARARYVCLCPQTPTGNMSVSGGVFVEFAVAVSAAYTLPPSDGVTSSQAMFQQALSPYVPTVCGVTTAMVLVLPPAGSVPGVSD